MSVIKSDGYQAIRDYIQSNWTYIELRDGSQNPIYRLPVDGSRVKWTHTAGAQVLELTTVIKGSDSDTSGILPKTFGGAAMYKVASGGLAMTEDTMTAFNMTQTTDQLTIVYQIQVPQV